MTAGPDIRVLHVLEAVRGGTSRHVADIVRHARGIVHHVALPSAPPSGQATGGALYDHAMVERMQADGAVVHRIEMRREPWHPYNLWGVARVRHLARAIGAGLVHGHSSVGGAAARLAGRAAGLPVVYTANGVATGAPYRLAERALGHWTDRWVAVSASEAEGAVRGRLIPAERLITIPNGIELGTDSPSDVDLRALLGLEPATPLVGTVARLVPQKAPEDFVRACAAVSARCEAAHFLLVGMGPLQHVVDREVERLGLGPKWHQIRHLDRAATALAQLDVYVLVSRFEGGPYTPLEAMRAGVPLVLSDVVGNRDLVEHGVTGFLAPSGSPGAVSDAVVHLLTNPDLGASVAGAAAKGIGRFDVEVMGARLAQLYRSLVRPDGRR